MTASYSMFQKFQCAKPVRPRGSADTNVGSEGGEPTGEYGVSGGDTQSNQPSDHTASCSGLPFPNLEVAPPHSDQNFVEGELRNPRCCFPSPSQPFCVSRH